MKNWRARQVKKKSEIGRMCSWNILITKSVLVHRATTQCKNKMVVHGHLFLSSCFFPTEQNF